MPPPAPGCSLARPPPIQIVPPRTRRPSTASGKVRYVHEVGELGDDIDNFERMRGLTMAAEGLPEWDTDVVTTRKSWAERKDQVEHELRMEALAERFKSGAHRPTRGSQHDLDPCHRRPVPVRPASAAPRPLGLPVTDTARTDALLQSYIDMHRESAEQHNMALQEVLLEKIRVHKERTQTRRNAQRNPTRTSTTASALTIGVALVSFITVVAYSANASIAALFEEQYGADLTVSVQGGFGTIPTAVAGEVAAVDGVASVNPVRLSQAVVPGEDTGFGLFVNGVDAGVVGDHLDLGVDESALAALERPDTAIVKQGVAEDEGLEVGDTYRLSFPSRSDVPLEIVGIAEAADVLDGAFIVDLATYEDVVGGASDQLVTVLLEEGADVDEAQAAVEEAVSDYPGTQVQTNNELLESIEQQVFTFLAIVFGLLVLALLIAFIGIANTLALSVLERTREIGMLRAVGMVRSQLRGIVYREAILVSAFGALLGIVIGTLFGWALVTALADEGINVLVVPPLNMIAYVVVASIAGVLAALWPGYRAARMNVLDAIYEE